MRQTGRQRTPTHRHTHTGLFCGEHSVVLKVTALCSLLADCVTHHFTDQNDWVSLTHTHKHTTGVSETIMCGRSQVKELNPHMGRFYIWRVPCRLVPCCLLMFSNKYGTTKQIHWSHYLLSSVPSATNQTYESHMHSGNAMSFKVFLLRIDSDMLTV